MSHDLHQRSRSDSPSLHSRAECYGFVGFVNDFPRLDRQMSIQRKNTMGHLEAWRYEIIQEKLQQLDARLCGVEQSNQTVAASSQVHKTSATAADSTAGNMLPGEVSKMVEAAMQAAVQDLIERIAVLESQVLVQEHDVMAGPHPTGGHLPSDQVVGQESSVTSRPQPTEADLPSDQESLEKNPGHDITWSNVMLEAREHCDHPIAESIWEAAILVNVRATTITGSAFLVFGLLFNILLQVAFLYVVYHSFLDSTLPDAGSVYRWRELQGHHADNMIQATKSSLVRALCDSDPLLLSSANQQSLYDAVLDYQASHHVGVPLGGLLCAMTLCTWVMFVGEEFHIISSFANAILHLPRGKSTQLMALGEDIVLTSCSMGRVIFVMLLIAVRLGVAATLLTFGSIWLARTVDLKELVLNACALATVLDMDELIFASIVTRPVKVLVREIKPLKRSMGMRLGGFCSQEGSIVMNELPVLLGAITFTAFILHAYVIPSLQRMEDIETAFCGGFKDFVFEQSSLDVIVVTGSSEPSSERSFEEIFVPQAIYDLVVGASSKDDIYKFNQSLYLAAWDDFKNVQLSDVGTLVGVLTSQVLGTSCEDYDFAAPGAVPSIRETIKSLFGDTVDSCEDLEAHCPGDYRSLRMICPETCGCNDPFSGLYKKGRNQGCPADCLASATYTNQLASIPCVDYNLSNLTQMPGWGFFLTQWLETWSISQPREAEALRLAASAMLTYGCVAIGLLPVRIQTMFCQPTSEYGSLNSYCPMSCDCINSALEDCPAQCSPMFS